MSVTTPFKERIRACNLLNAWFARPETGPRQAPRQPNSKTIHRLNIDGTVASHPPSLLRHSRDRTPENQTWNVGNAAPLVTHSVFTWPCQSLGICAEKESL